MEDYEKMQKKLGKLTAAVIILFIMVLGLGGYVVYDKVLTDKQVSNESEKKEEPAHVNEVKQEVKKEMLTIDKKVFNERLATFSNALIFALEETRLPVNIPYDKDLLLDDGIRFDLAWAMAHFDKVEKYIYGVTADGEEIDGAYALETESFKKYFKNMYGIDWNGTYSNKYSFIKQKDGYIYGGFYTGWTQDLIVAKSREMYKIGDNYFLILDILYGQDSDYLIDYQDSDVIDYDESAVSYKLKLELEKNGDSYYLKSMKAIV